MVYPARTLDAPVSRRAARGRTPSGRPNPIDVHVGNRMRLRRTLLGLTQQQLGEALGLTFQQVQKYENGANRIGASRLYDLCRVLDVPPAYFFDDMAEAVEIASPRHMVKATEDPPVQMEQELLFRRETIDLVRTYYRIGDPRVRSHVLDLANALSDDSKD